MVSVGVRQAKKCTAAEIYNITVECSVELTLQFFKFNQFSFDFLSKISESRHTTCLKQHVDVVAEEDKYMIGLKWREREIEIELSAT
jgi:hypothetical protein